MRNHLREDTVDGRGVDESDLEAEEARARSLVDQLGAGAAELRKRTCDIVDLIRDMVHPRPA
jgi:hypothetical protein